jgi:hypothetical protein
MIATSNVKTFGNTNAAIRIGANQVADQLLAAEAAIDAAIAAVAALTATIPTGSQQANVGMHVTHSALMHAMESCQQLVKSRTNIIRSHKALRVAQDEIGLGAVNFNGDCPSSAELRPAHLTAIAA